MLLASKCTYVALTSENDKLEGESKSLVTTAKDGPSPSRLTDARKISFSSPVE